MVTGSSRQAVASRRAAAFMFWETVLSKRDDKDAILLLAPSLRAVSGVSTHVTLLMNSELREQYRLIHFQVGSEGRKETRWTRALRIAMSPFAIAVAIVRFSPTIVHINTSLNQRAFWRDFAHLLVSKTLGRKVVFQIHGGSLEAYSRNGRVVRSAVSFAAKLADAVVVITTAEQWSFKNIGPRHLEFIPNGIDLDQFPLTSGKQYDSGMFRLLFIGRLHPDKGVLEAVEAIRILRDERISNDVCLTIVGSGPAEQTIQEAIRKHRLEDRVRLVGPVYGPEKVKLFVDADVVVFPTYHEGLPYVLLESLASGTPVVTTKVGGIPDIVQEGVHALFVKPHDALGLAKAISSLISDLDRLERMSANCVRRAREQYGVKRVAQQFASLYKAVAPRRRRELF